MSIFYTAGLKALFQREINRLAHSFYLDTSGDLSKTVFICGAGRSGTTWLGEVLNYDNRYRFMEEPFNREQVPVCRAFARTQYLPPCDTRACYLEPAEMIFSGRIRNAWIDQYNRPGLIRYRMVKDVRSTMMLKWIHQNFPQMPIIFIIRHPCAVAASRTRLGWKIDIAKDILGQQDLVQDYLTPFLDLIGEASSPFERWVIYWCVQNLVPLSQLDFEDACFVFYENLVQSPQAELSRLCSYIARPFDKRCLRNLMKPSASTIDSTRLPISRQARLSEQEVSFAQRAVEQVGLSALYPDNTLGDYEALKSFVRQSSLKAASLSSSLQ